MAVVRVDALCECDGCRKRFGVEVEINWQTINGFDYMVREEVRSGQGTYYTWGVRGKHTVDRLPLSHHPTVQGGLLLCDVCSEKCDALPVEGDLTKKQVLAALSLPAEDEDGDGC